jgi:hypothetical protein
MADGQSTVEEYRSRAAILRRLARETRDQEARERLILLAARFERLADQVERWQQNGRYRPSK